MMAFGSNYLEPKTVGVYGMRTATLMKRVTRATDRSTDPGSCFFSKGIFSDLVPLEIRFTSKFFAKNVLAIHTHNALYRFYTPCDARVRLPDTQPTDFVFSRSTNTVAWTKRSAVRELTNSGIICVVVVNMPLFHSELQSRH